MTKFTLRAVLFLAALVLVCGTLTSCQKKSKWLTDLDEAKKEAEMQNKDILALFSGEDWDGKTTTFRVDVLDTEEFYRMVKEQYVLLNIDLSQSEQAHAITGSDATEQQKVDAEIVQQGIDAKQAVVRRYGVSSCPVIYILSKEGYVLSLLSYSEGINSPTVFHNILEEQKESMANISALISKVAMSEGVEKARAINALYDATPEPGRRELDSLIKSFASLDSNNQTGLLGKYEFINTYNDAVKNISEGNKSGVVDSFVRIAENGHLDQDTKQQAYYNAAYLMAVLGDRDYDKMYSLLQKAQDVAPESPRAKDVSAMMEMVSKMRDLVNQADSLFPGLKERGN